MLLELPVELLEQIFLQLPLRDLLEFSSVNSSCRDLVNSSPQIWVHHTDQSGLGVVDNETSVHDLESFKERYGWRRSVQEQLVKLSRDHLIHTVIEISLEDPFLEDAMSESVRKQLSFIILSKMAVTKEHVYTRLTQSVYSRHLLVAMIQRDVLEQLETAGEDLLEGSLLVSRWVGASLFEQDVLSNHRSEGVAPTHQIIDSLAAQCRGHLNPSSDPLQVLKVINRVVYHEYGLHRNTEDYYRFSNNRIDHVLSSKSGIPITIAIVYYEVARRLGLTLQLINFPRHFLLAYGSTTQDTLYIDCFNNGEILSRSQCLQLCPMTNIADSDTYFTPSRPRDVLARLARNVLAFSHMVHGYHYRTFFILNLYKLMAYLAPDDVEAAISGVNHSVDHRVPCGFVRRFTCITADKFERYDVMMGRILESLRSRMAPRASQSESIHYNIGDVLLHKRYNYTCVVYGLDETCMMGADWEARMGIDTLELKGQQPFYSVLADDESERYVAQENLIPTRSVFLNHRDVGKYFRMYDGERFVPNEALLDVYPYLRNGNCVSLE